LIFWDFALGGGERRQKAWQRAGDDGDDDEQLDERNRFDLNSFYTLDGFFSCVLSGDSRQT